MAEKMKRKVKNPPPPTSNDRFGRFASIASFWLGSKWAFVGAGMIILVWIGTGPVFHYSNTWQLVINTGTTIVTFLMVFLIQNTQNRDARAINLKLDELIHSIGKARDQMINIENLSDEDLKVLSAKFDKMRQGGFQPGLPSSAGFGFAARVILPCICLESHQAGARAEPWSLCLVESRAGSPLPDGRVNLRAAASGYSNPDSAIKAARFPPAFRGPRGMRVKTSTYPAQPTA